MEKSKEHGGTEGAHLVLVGATLRPAPVFTVWAIAARLLGHPVENFL